MTSDNGESSRLQTTDRNFNSAFEIEDFEDVTLLLNDPLQPSRSLWSRFRSLFTSRSPTQGFKRLGTSAGKWCPEEEAGFLSRFFFTYMNSLIDLGMTKHLVQEDLWDISDRDEAGTINEKFETQLKKTKDEIHRPQGSVLRALWGAFGRVFLFAGLVKIIHDLLQVMGPEILRQLLLHLRDKDSVVRYYEVGIGLAVAMLSASILQTLLVNYYFHILYRISLHIKSALVWMIYAKSLRISSAARSQFGIGKIVNLQSNDASKLWTLVIYLHVVWSAPFQIFITLFQLVSILGLLPSLGGLAVIIGLIPVTAFIGKYTAKLRKDQMKDTDARVKSTTEIVTGIKAIKLYAWEDAYLDKIQKIREQELSKLLKLGFVKALSRVIYFVTPVLVSGAGFGIYILQGHHLTADVAFPALAYFQLLRFPVVVLPQQIMSLIYGKVAINRIQSFMDSEEVKEEEVSKDQKYPEDTVLALNHATFSWPPSNEAVLTDLSLSVKKGQLIQIVGDVGSGKSSFLSAIMGEMKKHDGTVFVTGQLAYTAQEPWIQNQTLQDNILMGHPYDEDRYHSILSACALEQDLAALPGGDLTEIGEKGVNLSGGQKHRVALARACYSNGEIYLLDDPLSAVDSHVGRHLFEYCIQGLLRGKTRILVSHQLQFIPQADFIVVMKLGKIDKVGTYDQLIEQGVQFSEFELHRSENGVSENQNGSSSDDGNEDLNNSSSLKAKQINSMHKSKSSASLDAKKRGKLIGLEDRAVGSVKKNVYWSYVRSWGPVLVMPNWWLATWTDKTSASIKSDQDPNTSYYLSIYYIIGLAVVFFSILGSIVLIFCSINASKKLYSDLVAKLCRLPMSFFDTQPTGRLINRFTSDTEAMDSEVASTLSMAMSCILNVVFSLIVVTVVTKVVIVAIVLLAVVYYRVQKRYITSTRELKRLDALGLSPIYSHFNESLQGLQTIRAFQKQEFFTGRNESLINRSNQAHWPLMSINRWLSVRLDSMSAFIVFITAIAVTAFMRTDAGLAGLALTSALNLTGLINWLIRQVTQLEVSMNAIERITEYKKHPTEKPAVIEGNRPDDDWPRGGAIHVKDLWVRYREGLEPVLKGLEFSTDPHERIGVCGRTGSGKSTLMMALYRIVEPYQGSIEIDGVNALEIGLYDLRKKLSLVPQDPVIFSGTIRSNLDPVSEQDSDASIWEALRQVSLHDFISKLPGQLDAEIEEGGQNLSVGQRQLLCMARALLRGSKLLILDEATSNVDNATDAVIQSTIRTSFRNCTVLTIAHRLHTIIDYDRVMVLENGQIVEFDTPQNLMTKSDGKFAGLVEEASRKGLKRRTKSSVEFLNKVNALIKDS
eukprot:g2594.t1